MKLKFEEEFVLKFNLRFDRLCVVLQIHLS